MSITFGTTSFDTDDLDLETLFSDALMGGLNLKPHLKSIVAELVLYRRRRVLEHSCSGEITLHYVTQTGLEVLAEFRPYVVGFSKESKTTPKAKQAVIDALVAKAGFATSIEWEGEMRKTFGTFKARVPIKKFLKQYGPDKRFHVDVAITWDLIRIKLPDTFPNGQVYVAFPYAAQCHGQAMYDCKKKRSMDALEPGTFYSVPMVPWVPKDKTPRKAAQEAAETQLDHLRGRLKRNEERLSKAGAKLIDDPENKRLQFDVKGYQDMVKTTKKRTKDVTTLRDAMRNG